MSDSGPVATLLPASRTRDEDRGSEAPANGPAGTRRLRDPIDIDAARIGPMEPRQEVD